MKRLLLALLVLAISARASHAALIGHWQFDEGPVDSVSAGVNSLIDSSGNGLHGTPFQGNSLGGPIYRSTPGSLGLEFDGINDRAFVQDSPLLALTQSLTIETTVRIDRFVGGLSEIVFRGDSRGSLDPYLMAVSGDRILFQIEDAAGNRSQLFSGPVATGQFMNLVGTLDDATGRQALYINGIEVASTTTTIRPFATLGGFFGQPFGLSFGALQSGNNGFSGQFFAGVIDEVKISDQSLAPSTVVPEPSAMMTWAFLSLTAFGLHRRKRRAARRSTN